MTSRRITGILFCRIYTVLSPQSTLMTDKCESNPRSAFGEDGEWSHLNVNDAIVYLSQRFTINDRRRILQAFGKTNMGIESIMLKYHQCSKWDIIHAYLSRWSESNPHVNVRELSRTLKKSELHLYAGQLNYLFNLTKCDDNTQRDSDTDE